MSKQELKLLTLKIIQWLSSGFSQLFNYLLLGVATVYLIYAAKVSHINISWASDFVTSVIELLFVAFIGASVTAFFCLSKALINFNSKCIDLMCKSIYVLWLVNEYGGLSATTINDKSQGLITALIIVFFAKWIFSFVRKFYSNLLVVECIDLDYIKFKDYKVTDSFIADNYKNVQIDSQSLSVTRDANGSITNANGYVIFKVAKLPVTLTFEVSPFMYAQPINDNGTAMLSAVRVEPKFVAKPVDKAIKL